MKDKENEEKIDNINEKFTYAMQSFQTNLGNMSAKISEQSLLVSWFLQNDFNRISISCKILFFFIFLNFDILKKNFFPK